MADKMLLPPFNRKVFVPTNSGIQEMTIIKCTFNVQGSYTIDYKDAKGVTSTKKYDLDNTPEFYDSPSDYEKGRESNNVEVDLNRLLEEAIIGNFKYGNSPIVYYNIEDTITEKNIKDIKFTIYFNDFNIDKVTADNTYYATRKDYFYYNDYTITTPEGKVTQVCLHNKFAFNEKQLSLIDDFKDFIYLMKRNNLFFMMDADDTAIKVYNTENCKIRTEYYDDCPEDINLYEEGMTVMKCDEYYSDNFKVILKTNNK